VTIRVGQVLTAIVSLVLLGAGWFFFAPTQLGGSDAYVQIYGTSMQPHFHAGDLVIVRATNSTFRVGDIVAYRNPTLGNHVVLHRIIEITGGRYVFKGDNNDFIDSYHPTRNELVGHMWVHAPVVGRYLVWAHGSHLFLVAGIMALITLLLGAGFGSRRVGRRARTDAPKRLPAAPAGSGRSFGALPATAAAALVAFAALATLSFARPLTTHAVAQGVYTQTGHFSYDAPSPEGARVYGSTTVTTGQPLFLRIVHNANFHFAYALSSAKIHAVSGTIALDAQVASPNGWKRTLHLAAPMSFSGDRTTITGGLSFRSLTKLLQRVDALSNLNGGTYTLTLLPKVHIHGIVNGNPVNDHFAPQLPLTLDPNELQLQQSSATGAGATSALTQAASGSGTVTVASHIALLKLKLSVSLARRVSLVGGALAAILLLAGILLGLRSRKADEGEQIARQYRDLIVAVDGLPATPAATVVRTSSIEGLARIADQAGRMVMHTEHAGLHTYFVEDSGVRYTYEHGVGAEPPDNVPGAAEAAALRMARSA
jgi:signal peptidase I